MMNHESDTTSPCFEFHHRTREILQRPAVLNGVVFEPLQPRVARYFTVARISLSPSASQLVYLPTSSRGRGRLDGICRTENIIALTKCCAARFCGVCVRVCTRARAYVCMYVIDSTTISLPSNFLRLYKRCDIACCIRGGFLPFLSQRNDLLRYFVRTDNANMSHSHSVIHLIQYKQRVNGTLPRSTKSQQT